MIGEIPISLMNAKQFILNNSPKFQEAVENGLDIRMEESEIFEWMERYRTASIKTVQLCPKCFGEGIVPSIMPSTQTTRQCPVCYGSKVFIV